MKFSDLELPSNRKFGAFFTAVFALAGLYFLQGGNTFLGYALCALSVTFLIVTLVNADLLLPLNKAWMGLGLVLGMIVSPIVLGLIFFVLFTPISLLMRLIGRDELRLRLQAQPSYWRQRSTATTQPEAFENQF